MLRAEQSVPAVIRSWHTSRAKFDAEFDHSEDEPQLSMELREQHRRAEAPSRNIVTGTCQPTRARERTECKGRRNGQSTGERGDGEQMVGSGEGGGVVPRYALSISWGCAGGLSGSVCVAECARLCGCWGKWWVPKNILKRAFVT